MSELLPCPFCGCHGTVERVPPSLLGGELIMYVLCTNAGCNMAMQGHAINIDQWNRRAPSPSLGEPCQHPAYKLYPVHFGREGTAHWCKVCGALRHGTGNLWMIPASPTAAQGQKAVALPEKLSVAQLDDACLTYTHDFGILPVQQRDSLRFQAEQWWHAFNYTIIGDCYTASPVPASGEGWKQAAKLHAALKQIVDGDTDPAFGFPAIKGLFHEAAPTWMLEAHVAIDEYELAAPVQGETE